MADGGVIKEFLVGLGWKIDRSSQRGFETALEDSKKAALALTATLTGVVAAVAKVAQSYEQLEYASQRAQSSVAGMQKFAFAISEMGGNADAARGSLQAMGNFMRSTPGGEGFIRRLGVQTRDANGAMRDTSSIMVDLGKQFRNMPYWRARASAGMLGIDENTLQAMIRGVGNFGSKYAAIYKRLGIDQNQAAKASTRFMQQFRLLGAVITAVRDKLAISLEPVIEHGIDLLYQFEEWVHRLDGSTKGWIAGIGAFIVAWRLMNTAIMRSPLGRVIALGVAVAALYDDYKTWQSGGRSLINWREWKPGIDAAIDAVKTISTMLSDMWTVTSPYLRPMADFIKHEMIDAFMSLGHVVGSVAQSIDNMLHGNFRGAWSNLRDVYSELQRSGQEAQTSAASTVNSMMPSSIRNNNPGNLREWGDRPIVGGFAAFDTPEAGVRAGLQNLRVAIMKHGRHSLNEILPVWAPRGDGRNDPAAYIKHVSEMTGIKPDQSIDPNNPDMIGKVFDAMSRVEGGFNPWRSLDYSIARQLTAGGGNQATNTNVAPTVNQNVTINGATNPQATADSVVRATHGAVNTAYRNFAPRRQ